MKQFHNLYTVGSDSDRKIHFKDSIKDSSLICRIKNNCETFRHSYRQNH